MNRDMEGAKSAFAFVRCSNRSERGGETRETFRTGREVPSESFPERCYGRFEARRFHSSHQPKSTNECSHTAGLPELKALREPSIRN